MQTTRMTTTLRWIESRCTTTALRSQTLWEEVQKSNYTIQAQSYYKQMTARWWRQLCWSEAVQNNGQYQDDMKDNSKSERKRKTQKSVKFQIEEDKVIYRSPCFALAGAWKSKTEFSKGRRMKSRIATCPNMLCLFEKDHNFRHGAGIQMNPNTMPTSGRHTVSRLAGVWWRG